MSPVPVLRASKMDEWDKLAALFRLTAFRRQVEVEAKTLIGAVQMGLVAYRCDRKEDGWSALQDLSESLPNRIERVFFDNSRLAIQFNSKRIRDGCYVTAVLDPVKKGNKWQLLLKIPTSMDTSNNDAIASFIALTGADDVTAQQFLAMANNDVEKAANLFFFKMEGGPEPDEDDHEDAPLVAAMEQRFAEILAEVASHSIQTLSLPSPKEQASKELREIFNLLGALTL